MCILIFRSGKLVLTGAKGRKEVDTAFEKVVPLLKIFKKVSIEEQYLMDIAR